MRPSDPDFRVVPVVLDDLVALQVDAEARGFSTRWSSVDALLGAVAPSSIHLVTLLRERRHGQVRSYRCLVLHWSASAARGATVTFDIAPDRLLALPALMLDADSGTAFARIAALLPVEAKE